MAFVIGILTFLLVVDCLFLVLLVLIQLPKKEAGVGVAFGGAATDALFGAGSGNVLTKATKYFAATLFVLTMVLSLMQSRLYHSPSSQFRKELQEVQQAPTPPPAPSSTPSRSTSTPLPGTNVNAPAEMPTNAVPALAPATSAPALNLKMPGLNVTNP